MAGFRSGATLISDPSPPLPKSSADDVMVEKKNCFGVHIQFAVSHLLSSSISAEKKKKSYSSVRYRLVHAFNRKYIPQLAPSVIHANFS